MCITALRCGHARSCSEYGGMYLLDSEDASIKTASSDGWYGSYLIITLTPNTRFARVCARRRPDWLRLRADSSAYLQGRPCGWRDGAHQRSSRNMQACRCAFAACLPPPAAANAAFMSVQFCCRTAAAALTSVPSPQTDQSRPQNVTVKQKFVTSFCMKCILSCCKHSAG